MHGIAVKVDYSSVPVGVHLYCPVILDYCGLISEELFLCLGRGLLSALLLPSADISTVSVV